MPLSDTARRLLAQRAGKPNPTLPPDPRDNPDADDNVDSAELARRRGFRERSRRENERFRLATDSEFWIALCFRKPGDPAKFLKALNLNIEDRYLPGPALTEALGSRPATRGMKDRARALLQSRALAGGPDGESVTDRMSLAPLPDPLAGLKPRGDLQAEAIAELEALHAALNAPPRDFSGIQDSPYWLVAYFASRAAKEKFLSDTELDMLGDKYLDGNQAARTLHLTL